MVLTPYQESKHYGSLSVSNTLQCNRMAKVQEKPKKKVVGKRSLKKNAPRPKGEIELYHDEIKDKQVGNLLLLNSANAWWMDTRKVEKLIDALKLGCMLKEAWVYAGITRGEYEYFVKQHPEFSGIKEACEKILVLAARRNVAAKIETDAGASYAFLQDYERKEALKDEQNRPVRRNIIELVDFSETVKEIEESNKPSDHEDE